MELHPPETPAAIQRELSSAETVLWSGQPQQGIVFHAVDFFLIPFSLIWAGGILFWEFMALTMPNSPVFFKLWGLPFMVVGLYITIGRFFIEARARQFTFYAVTNQRALIVSGKSTRRVQSMALRTPHLSLVEQRRGRGTINFGTANAFGFSAQSSWSGFGLYRDSRFDRIADARHVFDLIRDLQSSAAELPSPNRPGSPRS